MGGKIQKEVQGPYHMLLHRHLEGTKLLDDKRRQQVTFVESYQITRVYAMVNFGSRMGLAFLSTC